MGFCFLLKIWVKIDHAEQSATDALKTAEAISHLICNKTANKITKVSKSS